VAPCGYLGNLRWLQKYGKSGPWWARLAQNCPCSHYESVVKYGKLIYRQHEVRGTMTLTEQLRKAIKDSGKSLNRIAIEAGIPNPVVVRFYNGSQRGLWLANADKLANYFGLELRLVRKRGGKSQGE